MMNTERLYIRHLAESDAPFIQNLLNTEGWKENIGERNIHSEQDALNYIIKINSAPETDYRTVILKDTDTAIGIITLIQRDYLDFLDIGFAFLPEYSGNGYAYESARAVLNLMSEKNRATKIYAITIPENLKSIKLIEKLGLKFKRMVEKDDAKLHLYSGPVHHSKIT